MQWLHDKFVGLDSYGVPVTVNYRGSDTYRTRCGAFLSLISLVILFTYGYKNGKKLLLKESPTITVTNEVIDYYNDDTNYELKEQGVTIILQASIETANGTVHEIPEEYGRLVAF